MLTVDLYGKASQYFTGSYPSAAGNLIPPARFLSGLTTGAAYNGANLGIRRVNYYSGASQPLGNRLTQAGGVFVGIRGPGRAVFPLLTNWTVNQITT